jgi:hypothetical protein
VTAPGYGLPSHPGARYGRFQVHSGRQRRRRPLFAVFGGFTHNSRHGGQVAWKAVLTQSGLPPLRRRTIKRHPAEEATFAGPSATRHDTREPRKGMAKRICWAQASPNMIAKSGSRW